MASFQNYTVVLNRTVMIVNNTGNVFTVAYNFVPEGGPEGFLDVQALGGFTNDPNLDPNYINLSFTLGGQNLGTYAFHRWVDHNFIPLDRLMVMVPKAPPVQSRLVVASVAPPGVQDSFFFGPAIAIGEAALG